MSASRGWLPMTLVVAMLFVAAAGSAAWGAEETEGLTSRIAKTLNPAITCPHCGKEFSENRSMWMLLIGFVGQAIFTSRFLIQWIASERRKQSYIPKVFWYLSIVGSIMLLAYALSIKAWPVILGQAFGVIVYGRNLALIAREKAGETPTPESEK